MSAAAATVPEALLLVGPVLVLASLHVFFRDLSQLLSPALSILFYLTPILYPSWHRLARLPGLPLPSSP